MCGRMRLLLLALLIPLCVSDQLEDGTASAGNAVESGPQGPGTGPECERARKCIEAQIPVTSAPLVAREQWEAEVEALLQSRAGAAQAATAERAASPTQGQRPRQHCLLDLLFQLSPSIVRGALKRTNTTGMCDRMDDETLLPLRGFTVVRGALGPEALREAREMVSSLPVTRVEAGGRQYSDSFSLRTKKVVTALNRLMARWSQKGLLAIPPERGVRPRSVAADQSFQMRVTSVMYVSVNPGEADGSNMNWHNDGSESSDGGREHKFWVLLSKSGAETSTGLSNLVVLPSTGIDAVGKMALELMKPSPRVSLPPGTPVVNSACKEHCKNTCCHDSSSSGRECSGCDSRVRCYPGGQVLHE